MKETTHNPRFDSMTTRDSTVEGGDGATEHERTIQGLIWTFGLEGVRITREEAEEALRRVDTRPMPRI